MSFKVTVKDGSNDSMCEEFENVEVLDSVKEKDLLFAWNGERETAVACLMRNSGVTGTINGDQLASLFTSQEKKPKFNYTVSVENLSSGTITLHKFDHVEVQERFVVNDRWVDEKVMVCTQG